MNQAMEQASTSSDELGIEIVDVRVKQINLPTEVSNSIFQRMRAERAAVAREHRSEGQEQAEVIKANIDAKVTVMLADQSVMHVNFAVKVMRLQHKFTLTLTQRTLIFTASCAVWTRISKALTANKMSWLLHQTATSSSI